MGTLPAWNAPAFRMATTKNGCMRVRADVRQGSLISSFFVSFWQVRGKLRALGIQGVGYYGKGWGSGFERGFTWRTA